MGTANIILLTAAVNPDPRFGSVVSDPSVRLLQYRRAVEFWGRVADDSGYELAIVETSGSEVLAEEAALISFTATDALVTRGKGAVEAAALDYALSVVAPASEAIVVKVTGRLIVKNATRLLGSIGDNAIRARRTLDRTYCDSRLFLCSARFWAGHLEGMGDEVQDSDGRYLEHVLAHRVSNAEFSGRARVERFPERPSFSGYSGTSGTHYGSMFGRMASPSLGAAERILHQQLARKQV